MEARVVELVTKGRCCRDRFLKCSIAIAKADLVSILKCDCKEIHVAIVIEVSRVVNPGEWAVATRARVVVVCRRAKNVLDYQLRE